MGASSGNLGSVVVVGHKAYVTTYYPDENRPGIAVVDLRTLRARRIATRTGYFDGYVGYATPNAAATADGKYVIVAQTSDVDGSYHLSSSTPKPTGWSTMRLLPTIPMDW